MKASATLDITNQLHTKNIGVEFIVSDDDIIRRDNLTHVGLVKNGKLTIDAPQP